MGLTTVFLTVVYFTLMYFFAVHLTAVMHYCSVLEGIVHGWGTEYQTVISNAIFGPLFKLFCT